jgi:O-antigen/teichoic acid export membrane protein
LFARNIFLTFSTEFACVGLNFLTGVLLTRAMTPNDRGVMTLVMTFPLMVFNLSNLGLHEGTVFFIGRKKLAPHLVMGNALALTCILSVLVFIILIICGPIVLSTFMKGLPGKYWPSLIILVPATLLQGVVLSVLRANEQFPLLNLLRLCGTILLLVAFAVTLLVFKLSIGACITTYIVVTLLLTILTFICVSRIVPISLSLVPALSKDIIRYGLKSYLQIIFESINYRLDIFLIALFLVPEQVAYYGVATSLAELAWYLPNSVGSVLFSRLSNTPLIDVHQITAQACRITLVLTGLIIVGLATVSWVFVPFVYGPTYHAAVPALVILLPGILAMAVHKVLNRNFASRDRQQLTILSSVISLAIIVSLDLFLIPRWGINGAAFVSSLGYFVAGTSLLVFFKHDAGMPLSSIIIIRWSDMTSYWERLKLILHLPETQTHL